MRVKVYRNLHKHCYSVVSREKENYGRVISHAHFVALTKCEFRVSEKGRQRVLRERRKNVHAFVWGELEWLQEDLNFNVDLKEVPELVTYNPYENSSFIFTKDGRAVRNALKCVLSPSGVWVQV